MLVNALPSQICVAVGRTLTSLDLSGCSLTDCGLSTISKNCQVIESLKVSFCSNITGMKLKPLFTCPRRAPDFKTFVANGCKMVSFEHTVNLILCSQSRPFHFSFKETKPLTLHGEELEWSFALYIRRRTLSLMYVQFSWQSIELNIITQYLLQSNPSDLIFVKCSFEFSPIQ